LNVVDIDKIVRDPIFLPYCGWHDEFVRGGGDGTVESWKRVAPPAIQQWRSEFLEFVEVLERLNINGKCLQLGLGTPGASHLVWSNLFTEAWTLEIDPGVAKAFLARSPASQRLVVGSSFDPAMKKQFEDKGPFDLLFIDADHSYAAVESDFFAWGELVRKGGVIAFHDTMQGKGVLFASPTMAVWVFMDKLREKGYKVVTIGTDLGISYIVKE
jgi:hypothetical protein